MTETIGPIKPKILTVGPFMKKVCCPLVRYVARTELDTVLDVEELGRHSY